MKTTTPQEALQAARAELERYDLRPTPVKKMLDATIAALSQQAAQEQEPVARILHWNGPDHMPIPHGGVCARTFEEFPKGAGEKDGGYWKEGASLVYAAAPAKHADTCTEYTKGFEHCKYKVAAMADAKASLWDSKKFRAFSLEVRALKAKPAEQEKAQEGDQSHWKPMPTLATDAMLENAMRKTGLSRNKCLFVYRALLSSAPSRQAPSTAAQWDNKDAEIERLTDPAYLCHRGNRISLECGTSAIAQFVARAIANKDVPRPSPEQVAKFKAQLDAALAASEAPATEQAPPLPEAVRHLPYFSEGKALSAPHYTADQVLEHREQYAAWKIAAFRSEQSVGNSDELATGKQSLQVEQAPTVKQSLTVEQAPAGKGPESVKTWPERIWLQSGDEPVAYPGISEDITWCDSATGDADIEYVRADLAAPPAVPPKAPWLAFLETRAAVIDEKWESESATEIAKSLSCDPQQVAMIYFRDRSLDRKGREPAAPAAPQTKEQP